MPSVSFDTQLRRDRHTRDPQPAQLSPLSSAGPQPGCSYPPGVVVRVPQRRYATTCVAECPNCEVTFIWRITLTFFWRPTRVTLRIPDDSANRAVRQKIPRWELSS